jgi:hypothetical protein
MARCFGPRKVSRAERVGMLLGGTTVLAIIFSQVLFIVWMAGLT